jgi:hypothetical protein
MRVEYTDGKAARENLDVAVRRVYVYGLRFDTTVGARRRLLLDLINRRRRLALSFSARRRAGGVLRWRFQGGAFHRLARELGLNVAVRRVYVYGLHFDTTAGLRRGLLLLNLVNRQRRLALSFSTRRRAGVVFRCRFRGGAALRRLAREQRLDAVFAFLDWLNERR